MQECLHRGAVNQDGSNVQAGDQPVQQLLRNVQPRLHSLQQQESASCCSNGQQDF